MKKIVKITTLMLLIITCLFNYTYCFKIEDLTGDFSQTQDIKDYGGSVLSIISIISSGISIMAIIALGIKYVLGSVEEKAEYKKTLLPYFIGAIFVFGATTISGIVYNIFNK